MYTDHVREEKEPAHHAEPVRRRRLGDEVPHRRWSWIGLVLAVMIVGGLCWLAYPVVRDQKAFWDQMGQLPGSFKTVSNRLGKAETDLRAWYQDQRNLRDQIGELENVMDERLGAARKQSQEFAQQLFR